MTTWRLPCPNCDSGYRKIHESVSQRQAARTMDGSGPIADNDDATFVRCNNCRDIHTVAETRDYDVQGGIGI